MAPNVRLGGQLGMRSPTPIKPTIAPTLAPINRNDVMPCFICGLFEESLTFYVTGRRRPKAGANLQAQLAGGPVDGGVGHHFGENLSMMFWQA